MCEVSLRCIRGQETEIGALDVPGIPLRTYLYATSRYPFAPRVRGYALTISRHAPQNAGVLAPTGLLNVCIISSEQLRWLKDDE